MEPKYPSWINHTGCLTHFTGLDREVLILLEPVLRLRPVIKTGDVEDFQYDPKMEVEGHIDDAYYYCQSDMLTWERERGEPDWTKEEPDPEWVKERAENALREYLDEIKTEHVNTLEEDAQQTIHLVTYWHHNVQLEICCFYKYEAAFKLFCEWKNKMDTMFFRREEIDGFTYGDTFNPYKPSDKSWFDAALEKARAL